MTFLFLTNINLFLNVLTIWEVTETLKVSKNAMFKVYFKNIADFVILTASVTMLIRYSCKRHIHIFAEKWLITPTK